MAEQIEKNWRSSDLDEADKAMLAYSEKLTKATWDMSEDDVVMLRELDFSDSAILDINQVTAYYAYANRLVDGLGVELEEIHKGK